MEINQLKRIKYCSIHYRASIYFGADVTLTGETSNDWFGRSVSFAGDMNNDGFDDVIIGARWNNEGGIDAGRSYLYFGSSEMDNSADVTLTSEAAGDHFGESVSFAGDVNNDGYDDIIIGADGNSMIGYNMGRTYVYTGKKIISGISSIDQIPNNLFLTQNYPNPFNPSTTISYKLSISSDILLKIYSITGREIETLVNRYQAAGVYQMTWRPQGLASGIYFYQLRAGEFSETKKLV